jgi:hypothetical protein
MRIFAHHADAGKYQLETRYTSDLKRWEWLVLETKSNKTVFSGDSETLDAAKSSAATAIGLAVEAPWIDIGPVIELR